MGTNMIPPPPPPPPPPAPKPTHMIGENEKAMSLGLFSIWTAAIGIFLALILCMVSHYLYFAPYNGIVLEKFKTMSGWGTDFHIRIRLENGDERGIILHREAFEEIRLGDYITLRKTSLRFDELIDVNLVERHALEDRLKGH